MSTKFAIVTGGNQGMGLTTAKSLLIAGYSVTISCRSEEKGLEAVRELSQYGDVNFLLLDMNDLSSVRSFVAQYAPPTLQLLILNAGIMNTPFALTKDGFEAQYQVNHLAHFLLTHLLFAKLLASGGDARVVSLSSRAHMRHPVPIDYTALKAASQDTYDGWQAYGRSKLSNILFAKSLAKRFPLASSGVAFFSVHPGLVDTGLLVKGGLNLPTAIAPDDGIKCTMYVATSADVSGQSGEYYHNEVTRFIRGTVEETSVITAIALNELEADKCFEQSMEMLGLTDFGVN